MIRAEKAWKEAERLLLDRKYEEANIKLGEAQEHMFEVRMWVIANK